MKIVHGGRATGKSTQVITWAAQKPNRVVVVPSMVVAKPMIEAARRRYPHLERDWSKTFILASSTHHLQGRDVEIFVDELDWVLKTLLGTSSRIAGFTVNDAEFEDLGRRTP